MFELTPFGISAALAVAWLLLCIFIGSAIHRGGAWQERDEV